MVKYTAACVFVAWFPVVVAVSQDVQDSVVRSHIQRHFGKISYVIDDVGGMTRESTDLASHFNQATKESGLLESTNMLEEAARGGEVHNLPDKEMLANYKGLLYRTLNDTLKQHEGEQVAINASNNKFKNCTDARDRAVKMRDQVNSSRASHKKCRAEQIAQEETKSKSCSAMNEELAKTKQGVPVVNFTGGVLNGSAPDMVNLLQRMKEWSEYHLPTLNLSKQQCDADVDRANMTRARCKQRQSEFETGTCQLVTEQEKTCKEISVCTNLAESHKLTKVMAESRKNLWKTAKINICLIDAIDAIIGAVNSSIPQAAVDACMKLPVDTSGLDLVYPTLVSYDSVCSTIATLKKPGDDGWNQEEYAGLQTEAVTPCKTMATFENPDDWQQELKSTANGHARR